MSFIMGRKVSMQEQIKQNRDVIKQASRELDKEIFRLEFENKQLMNQIRQASQKNQPDVAKIHARNLIRNRAATRRFTITKANLQCLNLRLLSVQSTQAMVNAINQSGQLMSKLNVQIKVPELAKMLGGFQKEMSKMDDKQDMMAEMLDDVFAEDDEEQDTDALVNQVIDEACGVADPSRLQAQQNRDVNAEAGKV